jgi:hypothetical protein
MYFYTVLKKCRFVVHVKYGYILKIIVQQINAMKRIDTWDDREFQALSEYRITFFLKSISKVEKIFKNYD